MKHRLTGCAVLAVFSIASFGCEPRPSSLNPMILVVPAQGQKCHDDCYRQYDDCLKNCPPKNALCYDACAPPVDKCQENCPGAHRITMMEALAEMRQTATANAKQRTPTPTISN